MSDSTQDGVPQSNGQVQTSHHPEADPGRKDKNYYGIPPIKHAHWTWQIPVYFWIGGMGAGVHLFSTIAQILGHRDAALTRTSRYTVLGTMILSPILLIWDLGRPERFYNILRILSTVVGAKLAVHGPHVPGLRTLDGALVALAHTPRDELGPEENITNPP